MITYIKGKSMACDTPVQAKKEVVSNNETEISTIKEENKMSSTLVM